MKKPRIDIDPEWDALDIWWAFGPQGHPASMRVHVVLFDELNVRPQLWVLGPGVFNERRADVKEELRAVADVRPWVEYGERIAAEFGSDPYWHRCTPGHVCPGRCEACDAVRKREADRVRKWLAENPPPGVRK